MARNTVQRQKAMALVNAYNQNPKQFKDEEIQQIMMLADHFGLRTSAGRSRDKANLLEKVGALGAGAIDSMALGMIPNDWYQGRRTKNWGKAGRIGGALSSLFTPAGFAAGVGRSAGASMGAKIGGMALRGATAPGLVAGSKRGIGALMTAGEMIPKTGRLAGTAGRWAKAAQSSSRVGNAGRAYAASRVSGSPQTFSHFYNTAEGSKVIDTILSSKKPKALKVKLLQQFASMSGKINTGKGASLLGMMGKAAPYAAVAGIPIAANMISNNTDKSEYYGNPYIQQTQMPVMGY